MKSINKLKFFIKKLRIKEPEYNLMQWKSEAYDSMLSCVHINKEIEPVEAKDNNGNVLMRFDKSIDVTAMINIVDMLKAGGLTFDDSVHWSVTTK